MNEAVTAPPTRDNLSRRALREALAPLVMPNIALACLWFGMDVLVFLAASAVAVSAVAPGWKLIESVVLGLAIARLFIIGHDACHQALTPHRRLNRVLGRIAFLPSLTPYSLWELGHNQAHHGFTNLRGRDAVWAPMSPNEFAALPRIRQVLERVYRSGWGTGAYYAVELWWRKLYFPRADQIGGERRAFKWDSWLVSAFALGWLGMLTIAAVKVGTSRAEALVFGALLPLLLWKCLMGFVIYVHHTEHDVVWFDDGEAWAASRPYLSATLHIESPLLDALLHNILQHPVHHLDMTIPFYRLRRAQRRLDELAPGYVQKRALSWGYYWDVVRHCKLYDYKRRQWQVFPRAATAVAHEAGSSK